MSALVRCVTIGLILVALAATAGLDPGNRAGATTDGTPPVRCGDVSDAGTPVASPSPDIATPALDDGRRVTDAAGIRAALEARGLTVETEEPLEQPFFGAESVTRLVVTGGTLADPAEMQVYGYEDAGARAVDAGQITPDGNLKTVMITWIATPHFFCGERVIVLYLGEDKEAIALLTELFGPQFAGR